jgi:hypothetical protein
MSLLFKNLLKDLIVENSRFQVLYDKFVKPKDKGKKGMLPFETLFALIAADPTSSFPDGMDMDNVTPKDMDRVKIGKYTQWLLKNFITPRLEPNNPLMVLDPQSPQYKAAQMEYRNLFMENLYKVTGDLKKFERFKNRIPQEFRDINKLTPDTLQDQVEDFSLEKTKATKEEKKVASKTYEHPGADVVYRGQDWTVAKISDKGQIGKDAACFYGGSYNETGKGETRWCTSSPGLTWFDRYIKDGPLYVVIPNKGQKHSGDKEYGDVSGLPALRYQFHFPSNQFMDPSDRQINLIQFLNSNEEGLKQFFKPEFMKSLSGDKGTKVQVEYPNDSASKFIALYGFDEFFESLPENLERFTFKNSSRDGNFALNIPEDIGRFKKLTALNLVGCVASIPESICSLPNLQYLSLPDNPELQKLPECIGNMENLMVLNIPGGGGKGVIPQSVYDRAERDEDFHIFE